MSVVDGDVVRAQRVDQPTDEVKDLVFSFLGEVLGQLWSQELQIQVRKTADARSRVPLALRRKADAKDAKTK